MGLAVSAASVFALSSCDAIYEDLDPCPEGVRLRFVYDYNMEFANAFPSQVDCLTLLVYDKNGNFVTSRTEDSDKLSDENYRMTLDIPAGEYSFVAYGGMECPEASFHFIQTPGMGTKLTDNRVELNSSELTSPVGSELHPLFYGDLDMTVEKDTPDYTEGTVYMMKDTNNVRILLQNLNGKQMAETDFTYHLTADNSLMNYNNDVIKTSVTTYFPWTTGVADQSVENMGEIALPVYAEFSTARFVLQDSPRLIIKRASDGKTVIDINLITYLLMMKSQHFASMGSQEFLDRESRWTLVFFLDSYQTWIQTQIIINDWVVRINDIEQ